MAPAAVLSRSNLLLFGGGGVAYALRDEFTTAQAAPLGSPRTCEPGPGTLDVVDASNILSIASGRLHANGTPAATSGLASSAAHARRAGRAFLLSVLDRTTLGGTLLGLSTGGATDGTVAIGIDYGGGGGTARVKDGVAALLLQVDLGVGEHQWLFVMRATGGFLLGREAGQSNYRLQWVYPSGTADLFSKVNIPASAKDLKLDSWRVTDLKGPWLDDYGIATERKAVSVADDTITQTADAIVEHTITAATGVTQELSLRRTDDDNRWIIRMDQAGSTIKLIERNAGVETERASGAQTWTNGVTYRVATVMVGNVFETVVDTTARKWRFTSSGFNATATGVKVSRAGENLIAWPRLVAVAAV